MAAFLRRAEAGLDGEFVILVTYLKETLATLLHLYRQRADMESAYVELQNQWSWGGFTTWDLLLCQVAPRNVALIYNWWSFVVRCADPQWVLAAITSRPLLL